MADQITPNVPGDKVTVADVNQLTKDEKDKVKENVNKANPDLPQGTEVTVGNNGDVTITYPDKSTDTIPGKDLVVKGNPSDQPNTKPSDAHQITPNVPGDKVKVADVNQLTEDEKDKVKENVNKANPDLPQGTEVTVGDNGDVTITYPDHSTDVISGADLVAKHDQATITPNDADQQGAKATSQGQPAVKAAGSTGHAGKPVATNWGSSTGLGNAERLRATVLRALWLEEEARRLMPAFAPGPRGTGKLTD